MLREYIEGLLEMRSVYERVLEFSDRTKGVLSGDREEMFARACEEASIDLFTGSRAALEMAVRKLAVVDYLLNVDDVTNGLFGSDLLLFRLKNSGVEKRELSVPDQDFAREMFDRDYEYVTRDSMNSSYVGLHDETLAASAYFIDRFSDEAWYASLPARVFVTY